MCTQIVRRVLSDQENVLLLSGTNTAHQPSAMLRMLTSFVMLGDTSAREMPDVLDSLPALLHDGQLPGHCHGVPDAEDKTVHHLQWHGQGKCRDSRPGPVLSHSKQSQSKQNF